MLVTSQFYCPSAFLLINISFELTNLKPQTRYCTQLIKANTQISYDQRANINQSSMANLLYKHITLDKPGSAARRNTLTPGGRVLIKQALFRRRI